MGKLANVAYGLLLWATLALIFMAAAATTPPAL